MVVIRKLNKEMKEIAFFVALFVFMSKISVAEESVHDNVQDNNVRKISLLKSAAPKFIPVKPATSANDVAISTPVFSDDAVDVCSEYGYVRLFVPKTNRHLMRLAKSVSLVVENLTNGHSFEIVQATPFKTHIIVPFFPWDDVAQENAFYDDMQISATFYDHSEKLLRISAAKDASFVAMSLPFKLPLCAPAKDAQQNKIISV